MSSRSWERKVRKNTAQVNKARKKQGQSQIDLSRKPEGKQASAPRFTGRNIIFPVVLLMFVGFYNFIVLSDPSFEFTGMYWLTVISYIILASLFFFRKPYLTISNDYIQSRRMFGDKQLFGVNIKQIKFLKGFIVITPKNGSTWSFSSMFNRYPLDDMKPVLIAFAERHQIEVVEE